MNTATLVGNDTITLNNRTLADYGDGDVATLAFPNDLVGMKIGKNGNTLYAFNETGKECDFTVRVNRGSSDDKYFNAQFALMKSDFPSFSLITGELVKRIGDGLGNITREIYTLSGGVFTKPPEAKTNVEGDTEQAITVYTIKFSNAPRSLE